MEVFIFIALLVLFILLSNIKSVFRNSIKELTQTVDQLTKEIRGLRSEINSLKQSATSAPSPRLATPKEENQTKPVQQTKVETPATIKEKKMVHPEPKTASSAVRQYFPKPEARNDAQGFPEGAKENWFATWLRNNPDLEKFIGENLVNKIGIAVLVLGIAFFVKYAIDKEWINEIGRVSIGLLCGALLVGIAHYLRNSYRSFSSVLAGGGIAVFYFTIALAFHQYHLLSQTTSFIVMVVITSFAVMLSVLYNKIELAVIAAIGGFITPFLVATGEGNYIVLFTYLVILNIGLLSLSYFKRWPLVNVVSLFFTELIFAGWMIQTLSNPSKPLSYPVALIFATAFYSIFLGMNMLYQIKNKLEFLRFDFFILLFLTATYYAAGMVLLHYWNNGAFQGLFTLAVGMVNLSLALYFFRKSIADRNLLFLLIGLALTFITLTIPVQLHGHTITLFWSVEFVLLLWLHQRSSIRMFKQSSILVGLFTIISLLMDWNNAAQHSSYNLAVIFTGLKGIVTNIVATIAFAFYGWLLKRQDPSVEYILTIKNGMAKNLSLILSAVLLYLICIFGINLYFGELASYSIPNTYHRLITFAFGIILFHWYKMKSQSAEWWILGVAVFCLLMHFFSNGLIVSLRDVVLNRKYAWSYFFVHWASILSLLYLMYLVITYVKSNQQKFAGKNKAISWIIPALLVLLFSQECLHIYVVWGHGKYSVENLQQQYNKAVLTIIWAVCSFILMWLGMQYKNKMLRIASLSLFTLALLKLFFLDIRGISEGGKIAAFILLGILLLTVSFMYQKLKKMLIDDVHS